MQNTQWSVTIQVFYFVCMILQVIKKNIRSSGYNGELSRLLFFFLHQF